MESYYAQFVTTLDKFAVELHQYVPDENLEKIITLFDKLDMKKVILKYLNSLRPYSDSLKDTYDETIFENKIMIFPGVNISTIWTNLQDDDQKTRVWSYLKYLYVLCESMEAEAKSNTSSSEGASTEETETTEAKDDFNPYVGVGQADGKFNLEDNILNAPDELPEREKDSSMLDNLAGMGDLADQFRNMDPKEIDEATATIKQMMGVDPDSHTASTINEMLSTITDELKKDSNKRGNPLKNMVKIAEKVAGKMGPKLADPNTDMEELMNSTNNLTSEFTGGLDMKSLMEKMMTGGMGEMMANAQKQAQDMMEKNGGGVPTEFDSDYMNKCNELLNSMGLNAMSPPDVSTSEVVEDTEVDVNKGSKKKRRKNRKKKKTKNLSLEEAEQAVEQESLD